MTSSPISGRHWNALIADRAKPWARNPTSIIAAGALAAEMLLERIGGGKPPEPVLDTGFRIIERESA